MTVTTSRATRRATASAARATSSALLFRSSAWLFGLFSAAMVVAFWPSYFSRLADQPTSHAHWHGIAMTLWLALLVSQAWLIRSGNRATHRRMGTLSYVLVPLIVLTTVRFIHFRVSL